MARPASLQSLGGPLGERRIDLGSGDLVLGSAVDCEVRIESPGVEPRHARLVISEAGAVIQALGGPVGVNDDLVTTEARLNSGDFVWIGDPGGPASIMLQFTLGEAEGLSEATPVIRTIEPPAEMLEEELVVEETLQESGLLAADLEMSGELEPGAEEVELLDADEPEPAVDEPGEELEVESETVEPEAVEPEAVEPDAVEEVAAESSTAEPEAAQEEAIEPDALDLFSLDAPIEELGSASPLDLEPLTDIDSPFEEAPGGLPEAPPPRAGSVVPTAPWNRPTFTPPAESKPAEYASAWESPPPSTPPSTPEVQNDPGEADGQAAAAPAPEVSTPQTSAAPAPRVAPPKAPTPAPPPSRLAPEPASKRPAQPPAPAVKPRSAEPDADRVAPSLRPPARTTSKGPAVVGGLVAVVLLGVVASFLFRSAPTPVSPAPTPSATPPETSAQASAFPPSAPVTQEEPIAQAPPPPAATAEPRQPAATPLLPVRTPAPGAVRPVAPTPAPTVAAPAVAPPAVGSPTQPASQAPRLLEEARASIAARDLPRASQLLDQVLRLQPGNPEATAQKAEVDARIATLARKFSMARTTVTGGKEAKKGPTGFDLGGGGVVQTEFSAQIRCATVPTALEPGASYSVQCSILNVGTKAFKLESVAVTEVADSARAAGTGSVPRQDVAPQSTAVILERSGAWSAKSQWSLEIAAKTTKDESFRAVYSWR